MMGEKNECITVRVPINIALIKYWGKENEELVIPRNDSISLTIDSLYAETCVSIHNDIEQDCCEVNGVQQDCGPATRYFRVCNAFRSYLQDDRRFVKLSSVTNFATSSGLASSAAGFGALAVGLGKLGNLSETQIVELARLGSGSACRSVLPGFVHWRVISKNKSICETIKTTDASWSQLKAVVIEFEGSAKAVSSTLGMKRTTLTSQLFEYRVKKVVPDRVQRLIKCVQNGDFEEFAGIVMKESNQLHAVCMDSHPPLMYLNDSSRSLIKFVCELNESKVIAAYTFDAGPHGCIFLEEQNMGYFTQKLQQYFEFDSTKLPREYQLTSPGINRVPLPIKQIVISSVGHGPK